MVFTAPFSQDCSKKNLLQDGSVNSNGNFQTGFFTRICFSKIWAQKKEKTSEVAHVAGKIYDINIYSTFNAVLF